MNTKENTIDIYTYPENATPIQLAEYQLEVMRAAERGETVEMEYGEYDKNWLPNHSPDWAWSEGCRYRIARPKIAEGHNPDGLTEDQVGVQDGWRLLSVAEALAHKNQWIDETQWWMSDYWSESDSWKAYDDPNETSTLRTKNPPGHYLPKPEPVKKLVPWTFETAPKGCVLVRLKEQTDMVHPVTGWSPKGLCIGQEGFRTYPELCRDEVYSLDGIKWLPCGTEA